MTAEAEEGDLVFGSALAPPFQHPDKPREMWVNEAGVEPAGQRKGIGGRRLPLCRRNCGARRLAVLCRVGQGATVEHAHLSRGPTRRGMRADVQRAHRLPIEGREDPERVECPGSEDTLDLAAVPMDADRLPTEEIQRFRRGPPDEGHRVFADVAQGLAEEVVCALDLGGEGAHFGQRHVAAIGVGIVSHPEIRPEVGGNEHDFAEDAVIAQGPGRKRGGENDEGEEAAEEERQRPAGSAQELGAGQHHRHEHGHRADERRKPEEQAGQGAARQGAGLSLPGEQGREKESREKQLA